MAKSKKSILILDGLVRILIALVVLFFFVIPACNRLRPYFDNVGTESFESFAQKTNDMPPGIEEFLVKLNPNSAIIGFSKSAGAFKCNKCYGYFIPNTAQFTTTLSIDKPSNDACNGKTCVCLCDRNFGLEGKDTNTNSKKTGKCKEYTCRTLSSDIAEKTTIKKEDDEYWDKGFIFVRAPGMLYEMDTTGTDRKKNDEEDRVFYVEKKDVIGVCTKEMREYNKGKWGSDGCINTGKQ